jgi:hypothetical protein
MFQGASTGSGLLEVPLFMRVDSSNGDVLDFVVITSPVSSNFEGVGVWIQQRPDGFVWVVDQFQWFQAGRMSFIV